MTLATTALFSAAAAAAYLDGRYHIGQDVAAIRERRLIASITQAKARTKELSMWYPFEEIVRRCPDSPCLWYRTHPSQTAVQYTFQQTYDQALRWAAFLLHHGVKPGELVGTYLQNSPEFMFNMAACWAIGCAPALINYNLANDSLLHCLKIAGSKVVLVDEDADCRERIEAVRDRIENDLGMRIIVVDEAMRRSIDGYPATRLPDEHRTQTEATFPAFLFYTSGSTGLPKACAFQTGRAYVLGAPRLRTTGLKAHPNGDTWYDCMPLYHGTGCTVACTCLMAGLKLAIGRKFSVRNFWPDIHDSKANCFVYVGETARYLLAAPPSPLDKTHQLKAMYGNGMRPDVFQKFRERFNVPCVNEFFNSTEGMFSLLNVCQNEHLVGCVGHFGALQRYTHRDHYVPVRIDYEQGDRIWRDPKTGFAQRTPYSEGGEILVRCVAETDFCGYWNNPEATAKRFERDVFTRGDLWYRTGDALRMDHDGRWFFLDRLGDTFRWKSENVSTAEVAEVLGHFPGVVEANVYGVEIPGHDGRAGCAAVYIPPNKRKAFDYAALLAHARKALPKYAVPVFLRVIKSPTPMHNNKQNKVPLRKEGVDPAKITTGEGGSEDVMLWVKPGSTSYEAFSTEDWKALMAGNVRL